MRGFEEDSKGSLDSYHKQPCYVFLSALLSSPYSTQAIKAKKQKRLKWFHCMIWFFPFLIPCSLCLCPIFSLSPVFTSRLHCWSYLVVPRIRTHDRTVSIYKRWDGRRKKSTDKPRIKSKSKYNHNEKKNDRAVSCLVFYESKRIYYMASATHLKRVHSWVMHVLVENITRSPVSLFAPTEPFFQAFLRVVCAIYTIYGVPAPPTTSGTSFLSLPHIQRNSVRKFCWHNFLTVYVKSYYNTTGAQQNEESSRKCIL